MTESSAYADHIEGYWTRRKTEALDNIGRWPKGFGLRFFAWLLRVIANRQTINEADDFLKYIQGRLEELEMKKRNKQAVKQVLED